MKTSSCSAATSSSLRAVSVLPLDIEKVRAMYEAGRTQRYIATALGTTQSRVSRLMMKHGIPARERGIAGVKGVVKQQGARWSYAEERALLALYQRGATTGIGERMLEHGFPCRTLAAYRIRYSYLRRGKKPR